MKLKKAKTLLDKINNLFASLTENPGKISAMERDLLLNYLRDLYDMVLEGDKAIVPDTATLQYQALLKEKEDTMRQLELAKAEAEKKAQAERLLREEAEKKAREELERQKLLEEAARKAAKQKEEEEKRRKAELEARLKIEEEIKLKAAREAAIKEAALKEAAIKEAALKEAVLKEAEKKVVTPDAKPTPPTSSAPAFDEDLEELFETGDAMDLSQKISMRPIKNIKKAISINDRLLFINELFNKDAPAMESVISAINDLNSFDQARLYLEQKVINQYNWVAKKRKKKAMEFIHVVRRRFL
ncbi:MAG: hypothetical protein AAF502_05815 [Bacteroidota bacterium]